MGLTHAFTLLLKSDDHTEGGDFSKIIRHWAEAPRHFDVDD